MFTRIGSSTVRRRKVILGLTVLFLVVAGVVGGGVFGEAQVGRLRRPPAPSRPGPPSSSRTTSPPATPTSCCSCHARRLVGRRPGQRRRAGASLTARWPPSPASARPRRTGPRRSTAAEERGRRRRALVLVRVAGDDDAVDDTVEQLQEAYDGDGATGSTWPFGRPGRRCSPRSGRPSRATCASAEAIAVPITLVLLVLVFGSVVAGLLPPGRRRGRRARHVPVTLSPAGVGHRRVDLLHQPHHGPRPRPGHRLLACSSSPGSGRSCGGPRRRRRRHPHRRHRRPDGGVQRG